MEIRPSNEGVFAHQDYASSLPPIHLDRSRVLEKHIAVTESEKKYFAPKLANFCGLLDKLKLACWNGWSNLQQ